MKINYPAGITPGRPGEPDKAAKHLLSTKNAANRGMDFEADINASCLYYKENDVALITKRPTPINVVKVDYSHGAKITHAYFEKQSTTDYNGVYRGRYLDFEAKETRSRTSFPLSNIAPQQVEHLENVKKHGGFAFFLIHLTVLDETYLLKADYVCDFYRRKPRKSIPFGEISENGFRVKEGYSPRYDFLEAFDRAFK